MSGNATKYPKCKICQEEHPLGRCPKFFKGAKERVKTIEAEPPPVLGSKGKQIKAKAAKKKAKKKK